jgi:hypothetical protein
MTDLIPNAQPRNVTFTQGGDDDKTGDSTTFALATLGEAVTRINALLPVPDINNPASIIGYGAGTFADSAILADAVQLLGGGSRFVNDDANYTIKLGNFCAIESTVVHNTGTGDSILMDGVAVTATYQRVVRTSNGGAAYRVTGASSSLLIGASQIRVTGGTGIHVDATVTEPLSLAVEDIALESNNDVAFDLSVAGGRIGGRIGNITAVGGATGTTAVFRAGQITLQGNQLRVDEVRVKSGAEVWLNDYLVDANIVVEAGGVLHCRIYQGSSYTITNNGQINGDINGTRYGSFAGDNEVIYTFSEDRNFTGSMRALGAFSIDTATTTIGDATAYYSHNVAGSRTAEFTIVDAATLTTVYYSGSSTQTAVSPPVYSVQLASTGTPLPSNQTVALVAMYQRTSGAGGSSLSNPSITISAIRT